MKNRFLELLLIVLSFSLLAACSKEEENLGEAPKKDYATLDVTVEKETDNGIVKLPGAQIYVYEEKFYQQEGSKATFEGATDGQGKARFSTLEKPIYYITVVAPNGKKQEYVEDTPARSITYLYVLFRN